MPKIPLYAEGAGSLVKSPVGQTGPRASVAAFTAPSQALIGLGQQVGKAGLAYAEGKQRFEAQKAKIDFDFAMAEKQAEDKRIVSEEADAAVIATSAFLEQNQDTDTTAFNANFDTHRETLLEGLQSKNYTKRRLDLVTDAINNSIRAQRSTGANRAFDRGQFARTTASESTIETAIQQAALYPEMHPERVRLETIINEEFVNASESGLKLKYTQNGVTSQLVYQDYARQFATVTNDTDREAILQSLNKDPRVTQPSREKLQGDSNTAKSRIREANGEFALTTINRAEIPLTETDDVRDAILNDGVYTFTDSNGQSSSVDFSVFKEDDKDPLLTALTRNQKNLEDVVTNNQIFTLQDNYDYEAGVAGAVNDVNAMYTPENRELTGKSDDQLDDVTLTHVAKLQSDVTNAIAEDAVTGNMMPELLGRLDAAEAILNAQLGGRTPLSMRPGTDGATAAKILKSIAVARKDLRKAAKTDATIVTGANVFLAGDFEFIADTLKEPEVKAVVDNVMAQYAADVPKQISLLSQNDAKYVRFANILNAQANRMTDPNFDPESEEAAEVFAGVELYRQMKIAGQGVVSNHVTDDEKKIYESYLTLEPHRGSAGAIQTIQQQRDDIQVDASYKLVQAQVESIADSQSAEYSWYEYIPGLGRDEEFTVQDQSSIISGVRKLTKEYIALGVGAEKAVELAAKDWGDAHVRVRNVMIPKTRDLPTNIEEMANAAVSTVLTRYPEISEQYESDELSIGNVQGTTDRWLLISGGGYPVQLTDGTIPEFTKAELMGLIETEKADEKLIKAAKIDEINTVNTIETQFRLRTGPFEGMGRYEAEKLKLRLLKPHRSFRLTSEDLKGIPAAIAERLTPSEAEKELLAPNIRDPFSGSFFGARIPLDRFGGSE